MFSGAFITIDRAFLRNRLTATRRSHDHANGAGRGTASGPWLGENPPGNAATSADRRDGRCGPFSPRKRATRVRRTERNPPRRRWPCANSAGDSRGTMLSLTRLAKRSSIASGSLTPRTCLDLSSTPISSVPPAVLANAMIERSTPSGHDKSRLNSNVLPSGCLSSASSITTLNLTLKPKNLPCF